MRMEDLLMSLLYLSYSLRVTSFKECWIMVTVFPPMASLITTLALSGSTPSICERDNVRTRKRENKDQITNVSQTITGIC